MRIPNLSVSDSVTRTIRDLELKRFELDQQISTGQKIKYPEDDGLRVGKLINLESEKSKLSQYKRNSSQAKEFLNAGHLNLDHLRQLNQRGIEIARVAGPNLTNQLQKLMVMKYLSWWKKPLIELMQHIVALLCLLGMNTNQTLVILMFL